VPEAITVVVPTRDRPELLDRCLAAIRRELEPDDRLVVVDSAPVRSPADVVAAQWGAQLVSLALPGASRARNAGWRAAPTTRVAFVDDDVIVGPGWRRELTAPRADFVLGAVGQEGSAVDHPLGTTDALPAVDVDRTGPLQPGVSANLLVSRTALESVQGFDEALGPGTWFAAAEDLDLFDRLVAAGFVGRVQPTAVAQHVQWRDDRQTLRTYWCYGKGMGARLSRLTRTDRARARALLPGVVRLGGLRTAAAEVRPGATQHRRAWGPPIVWRLGAVAGVVVGFVRLPARPRASA
jgi:hypothetical protein